MYRSPQEGGQKQVNVPFGSRPEFRSPEATAGGGLLPKCDDSASRVVLPEAVRYLQAR
jgi:hypothetical protein